MTTSRDTSTGLAAFPSFGGAEAIGTATDDLRALLYIRHFERLVLRLFDEGKLHGTTHTCLGQEVVPVALRPLMRDTDFVISSHRSHGHWLAWSGDGDSLLAELLGHSTGISQGIGGSQHLYGSGFLSTGVQGQGIAIGAGIALDFKMRAPTSLVWVYVGDGTWGEGAVYESLNIASLWQLPLIVVVENNGIAQSTPIHQHMAGTVAGRAAAFDIQHLELRPAMEFSEIRAVVDPAVRDRRATPRPLVLEFVVPRLGPHSKGDDTRTRSEVDALSEIDWYERFRALDPCTFEQVEGEVTSALNELVDRVARDGTR